ncbi:hypothetical protein [Magnetovibrio blakemorei]|uniref:Uncharacterized protein n=1 Tax=Magnetovibrio blakemorei TaxID=28181 RepID=C4RAD7_9PROT|nr:hypothetical protein [Magnetovibrio blakemorei]OEJ63703.1 hypothetical protein BEN30_17535 [Magnetovibrio blakemorei]CAV30782.1 hypothetical protein mv1g00035 [Magnetovibrio blakemorei]
MKNMDKIASRVQAAKASLARQEANHDRQIGMLSRELLEIKENLSNQHVLMEKTRTENERLARDNRTLSSDNIRYKEMLMTLLGAIEGRQDGTINDGGLHDALEDVSSQASRFIAEQPEPKVVVRKTPIPKLVVDAQQIEGAVPAPSTSDELVTPWYMNSGE